MINKHRNFTLLIGVLIATLVMSCQTDDAEIPVQQVPDQVDNEFGSSLVAKYTVTGDRITLRQNGNHSSTFYSSTANQNEFWSFYTGLIPSDMRGALTELVLFADDEDGTSAYVAPVSDNDLSRWEMGFNLEYVWTSDRRLNKSETAYTSIHEFAHILTLDNTQVTVSSGGCNGFFTGEGCSNSGSYISDFFNGFWADIYAENQSIDLDNDDQFYAFYDKYKDRFVTEYGATNPGEDIAESFTMFVIRDIPTGNKVADQKVKFFYNYSELVTMRDRIRTNIDFEFDLSGVVEARSERFKVRGRQEF